MKKPKPQGKPVETSAEKSVAAKEIYGLPTPEQIATLAACLAKDFNEEPNQLTEAALDLWKAAELTHWCAVKNYTSPVEKRHYIETLTVPELSLTKFLLKALPHARPEVRRIAWKQYNFFLAEIDPSAATAVQEIEASRKWDSPKTGKEYVESLTCFQNWWEKHHAADVSRTRIAAVKKKRKARPPREQLKVIVKNLQKVT